MGKTITRIFVSSILITLLWYSISPAQQTKIPKNIVLGQKGQELDMYLERLSPFGFNGSVLVAQKGRILLHRAYGQANVEQDIPNHTNTLFSTGSVTKQFTAAGIMLLEMRGMLSTDDSIGKYFADVPPDKSGITIHHLLTHTSGIGHDYGDDYDIIGRQEYVTGVLQMPLLFSPGEKYFYSNTGYSLLAVIIEIVSDTTYEAFLQKNLFKPLGMQNTGLHLLEINDTLVAHSHNKQLGYPSPADRPRDCWNLIGNGGILSTAADMYRWYTALSGAKILSPEATEKIFTPYVKEYPDMESYYGYGWVIQNSQRRDSRVIWHNGGAMPHGWSCAVYNYVSDSAIFIVFSNRPMDGVLPVDNIAMGLSRILFGEKLNLPPQTISLPDSLYNNLEEIYLINDDNIIRVALAGGEMRLYPIGQQAVDALFPSPMEDMLPKYNDKTSAMIGALKEHDFIRASEFWDVGQEMDAAEMLREWWSSFDSLGQIRNFTIIGTRMGDGAQTFCRVNFEEGTINLMFGWMGGFCQGAVSGKKLEKIMRPISKTEFVSYSILDESTLIAELTRDNKLIIRNGNQSISAEKK